jgi:hypothetical protein
VESVEKMDEMIRVGYRNGDWVELGVTE